MAKLNLSNNISAQVADLFNKALTSKSATNLIGLRITIDLQETLPVNINGSTASALLGWLEPGQECKEVWASWLTRRGTSSETGEVFSNLFIVNDEKIRLSPQAVMETISTSDLLLEEVVYHYVVEAVFSSTGQRTGEKEMRRPFFTWRVLPRREIPAKDEWSQEVKSRLSEEGQNKPDQTPEKASPKSSKPRKTSTKKAATTAATDADTSDDVPF